MAIDHFDPEEIESRFQEFKRAAQNSVGFDMSRIAKLESLISGYDYISASEAVKEIHSSIKGGS
jgi:hypothetical protein